MSHTAQPSGSSSSAALPPQFSSPEELAVYRRAMVPGADGQHDDHGQSPAAWTAVSLVMLGVLISSIAMVADSWPFFWVGVVVAVVGPVVGKVMAMMGMGAEHDAAAPSDERSHPAPNEPESADS